MVLIRHVRRWNYTAYQAFLVEVLLVISINFLNLFGT